MLALSQVLTEHAQCRCRPHYTHYCTCDAAIVAAVSVHFTSISGASGAISTVFEHNTGAEGAI